MSGAEVMRRLGGVADNAEARAGALLRSGLLAGPSPGGTSDINTGAEYSPVSPVWAPSGTDAALNSYLRWPFAPRPASEVAEALRERVERLYSKFLAPGGASVDYAGLSASPEFRTYCDAAAELQAVDLTGLRSNEERIAFWVNIYNALIVHGTALRGSPQTTPERLGFFAKVRSTTCDLRSVNLFSSTARRRKSFCFRRLRANERDPSLSRARAGAVSSACPPA